MPLEVKLTLEAERQVLENDAWWRANRDKAPALFMAEFAEVLRLLEVMPESGRRYSPSPVRGTRRVLMMKTRFHVYYVNRPERSDVVVLAVWSSVRGHGPVIPQPPP